MGAFQKFYDVLVDNSRMTSRLFVGWSLSTPFQQIAGTDGAKLHQ